MNLFIIALSLPGGPEMILILLALLLLFGGRKIPELMKGLGKGMKEFKKAKNDMSDDDIDDNIDSEPEKLKK